MELWAILCLPELLVSVLLAYFGQSSKLGEGLACVLLGHQANGNAKCQESAFYFWMGLPFGCAYNLAIPILIQIKGSTSVPLFRALALPISALLAMTNVDRVIHTPFSWDAVLGVILCTTGLLVFYGKDVQQVFLTDNDLSNPDDAGYNLIPDVETEEVASAHSTPDATLEQGPSAEISLGETQNGG